MDSGKDPQSAGSEVPSTPTAQAPAGTGPAAPGPPPAAAPPARAVTASPIDKDQRIALELDGQLPGFLPATFQIIPHALRIRCPR